MHFPGIGSKRFVEHVNSALGAHAKGRRPREGGKGYQLREPSAAYGDHLGVKNEDIEVDTPIFKTLINKYQRDR